VQHVKFSFRQAIAVLLLASPALAQTGAPIAKNPIGWPPRLEVGQLWYVGIGKQSFNVNLNAKDSDGDPAGKASSSAGKTYDVFFFYNKSADLADLYIKSGTTGYRCLFDAKSVNTGNANDLTMVGAAFLYDATAASSAERFKQQAEPCLVTWTNAPNAPASIQTGGSPSVPTASTPAVVTPPVASPAPTVTPPTAPTVTGNAPAKAPTTALTLAWPPKIMSGQKWYLSIGSSGYDLALTKSGANGISSGTATTGPNKRDAYFYFNGNENRAVLEMSNATDTIYCYFGIRGAEDKLLNGDAAYKIGNGNIQPLTDKCKLYLLSTPATVSLLLQPLI
jgi:hypothetical protein